MHVMSHVEHESGGQRARCASAVDVTVDMTHRWPRGAATASGTGSSAGSGRSRRKGSRGGRPARHRAWTSTRTTTIAHCYAFFVSPHYPELFDPVTGSHSHVTLLRRVCMKHSNKHLACGAACAGMVRQPSVQYGVHESSGRGLGTHFSLDRAGFGDTVKHGYLARGQLMLA